MQVGKTAYDVRLWDATGNTFDIGCSLGMNVVPGQPVKWAILPAVSDDSPVTLDEAGVAWYMPCGAAFTALVEAVDTFGNRCAARLIVRSAVCKAQFDAILRSVCNPLGITLGTSI